LSVSSEETWSRILILRIKGYQRELGLKKVPFQDKFSINNIKGSMISEKPREEMNYKLKNW